MTIAREDDEVKYAPKAPGSFQRGPCRMQNWIEKGGVYPPDTGRYHLFVNYGCGWSHQAMLVRSLKGLQDVVSISHVGLQRMGDFGSSEYRGWSVPDDPTGNGFVSAKDIYNSNSDYGNSQLTIPILFDKEGKRVVSNDPAHILIMLNSVFDDWLQGDVLDFYPVALRKEIEHVNDVVFPGINDGVYRCWLAKSNEAYQEGFQGLQAALAWVETRLKSSPYLCGNQLSLADIRAFPHLFRFDVIYHKMMLQDPKGPSLVESFPTIDTWMKRLFETPAVRETCDLVVAARFYFPHSMTDEDCDVLYADNRTEWMPSAQELAVKRKAEDLKPASARKDCRGLD
eukprot:TRINITY_DN40704_c0_g1_i1.p1 TRINITY_DN40704_c0_g1~~TRINITY_DN40704_c0_g1_i1.p1  ORF type:complete len:341 (-),score=56.75 TRINITY_DN40704_c0_g1_i1:358-1380(-)